MPPLEVIAADWQNTALPKALTKADTCLIGPGMGLSEQTENILMTI